jgi:hypothetical protein
MDTLVKLLPLLLLSPLIAQANEAQIGCNLARTQAEVTARVQEAPVAYGTANDTTDKAVTIGIAQSLRGRTQAGLTREAAEAKCDALRATVALEEHGRFATVQVQKQGALAELRLIEEAILLAKSHISLLDAQLAAQTITITEHTAARQVLVNLEQRQAALLRTIAKEVPPVSDDELPRLVDSALASEARAAGLLARSQAESGWDVRPSIGVRQTLNSGQASTFIGLAFTYSFGYTAAKNAASQVAEQTESYLAAQGGGFTQTLMRQRSEVQKLYDAEVLAASTSARQIAHLETVLKSIDGIDTALANNTRRNLQIQLKVLQAEENGATARVNALNRLRDQLNR